MKKEMLINASQAEECRIAVLEDGQLEELYTERASQDNWVGNVYKGRIVNIEPSIQAAFVDFGVGRNGFLHISDVEPQYFRQAGYDPAELEAKERAEEQEALRRESRDDGAGGGRGRRGEQQKRAFHSHRPRFKPPIQEIFRRGDQVLVQVIKEGIGNKGPTLSTYISIPGRYLVLMPALGRIGVSRKIEDEDQRKRLRSILLDLNPPKGVGFIVRTAGQDRTRQELAQDIAYLLRLWNAIVRRVKNTPAPCDVYEESDMLIRTIRDIFTDDIDRLVIDDKNAYERAKDFLELVMPSFMDRLELYDGKEPLFHHYNLENEITLIHQRVVPLKGGGSIVIDPTEALVAIDVNSGSFRSDDSAEENAFKVNIAAAREITRQLRLRDLGGVIVNDFIDMRRESHRRRLERELQECTKRDRARTKILRTSPFGLVEMTRQRIRTGLKRNVYEDCPCCQGRGLVKTPESMAIEVVRLLMMACQVPKAARITVRVSDKVAAYLNNKKRRDLMSLEESNQITIQILGSEAVFPEFVEFDCRDREGNALAVNFANGQWAAPGGGSRG